MKHICRAGSPAAILMGRHYATGGDAMPAGAPMSDVGARRASPNLEQRFSRGGRAAGGQMNMEDSLKASGIYSSRGGEMDKEDRRRASGGGLHKRKTHFADGGDIGVNTGSSIARKPGSDAIGFKKGGHVMHRAMGGAGKTRKNYPMT